MTRSFCCSSEPASPNLRFWLSFDSTAGDAVYDGRKHVPVAGPDYIKRHIRLLYDKFLVLAVDNIRRYLEDYAEYEANPNLWQYFLDGLKIEQRAYHS